jgi:hypothetical protein
VFATELGSALSHGPYGIYSLGFPGALDMAVQGIQGMELNVTTMDLFASEFNTSNSWFSVTGNSRPDYVVYSQILSHLGPVAFNVTISGRPSNVTAIATVDPLHENRTDLLLVNTDLRSPFTFVPSFPGNPPVEHVVGWGWNGKNATAAVNRTTKVNTSAPSTPVPVLQYSSMGPPAQWTVPPQGLALFEMYPGGGSLVNFSESGLNESTRWFLGVDGSMHTSNATNFSLLLPLGVHDLQSAAFPMGPRISETKGRIEPFPPPEIVVGNAAENFTIPFVRQWAINISGNPQQGTVTPRVFWWNASTPLSLNAAASLGYIFHNWTGIGGGSYSGRSQKPTIIVNHPISETANFLADFPITLFETGLPSGTSWSAEINNQIGRAHV